MDDNLSARRGARRRADVSPALRAALERGDEPALSLSENLVVDVSRLFANVFPELAGQADAVAGAGGYLARMRRAGELLGGAESPALQARALAHRSDTVRGFAAYALSVRADSLESLLAGLRPLAADAHSGVREWAWLAARPAVAAALEEALERLWPWTFEADPNLRRFASEVTRPRGVWCAHLPALRAAPGCGLPLLEPLRADPTKYVQDSVANWLNDASKDAPAWVREVCARWGRESPGPATARIVRRALRTVGPAEV